MLFSAYNDVISILIFIFLTFDIFSLNCSRVQYLLQEQHKWNHHHRFKKKTKHLKVSHYSKHKAHKHTLKPTLAAVLLITVVHAVEHVIATPAPRDAVSTIQTKELIFPALLHTANLQAKEHHQSATVVLSSDAVSQRLVKHLLTVELMYTVRRKHGCGRVIMY